MANSLNISIFQYYGMMAHASVLDTGVHHVLLVGCNTAKVLHCIWECFILGTFQFYGIWFETMVWRTWADHAWKWNSERQSWASHYLFTEITDGSEWISSTLNLANESVSKQHRDKNTHQWFQHLLGVWVNLNDIHVKCRDLENTHTNAISPAHNNVRRYIEKRTTFLQQSSHTKQNHWKSTILQSVRPNSTIFSILKLGTLHGNQHSSAWLLKAFNKMCCHTAMDFCVHAYGHGFFCNCMRGLFCIKNAISVTLWPLVLTAHSFEKNVTVCRKQFIVWQKWLGTT